MEKEAVDQVETREIEKQEDKPNQPQSKYADYVHTDGRSWVELTKEERRKIKKKLNKKKKKEAKKKNMQELTKKHEEKTKGKSNFEKELLWCIDQIKLGLTHNAVTPEQCEFMSIKFSEGEHGSFESP